MAAGGAPGVRDDAVAPRRRLRPDHVAGLRLLLLGPDAAVPRRDRAARRRRRRGDLLPGEPLRPLPTLRGVDRTEATELTESTICSRKTTSYRSRKTSGTATAEGKIEELMK